MSEEKTTPGELDQEAIAKQEAEAAEIKKNIDAQLDKQKDVFRNRFKFLREFMAKCNGLCVPLSPTPENMDSVPKALTRSRLTEARMWAERMHHIVLMRSSSNPMFIDVIKNEESIPVDKKAIIEFVPGEGDLITNINDEINNLISSMQSEQPITNDNFEFWAGTYIVERLMEAQMWLQEI